MNITENAQSVLPYAQPILIQETEVLKDRVREASVRVCNGSMSEHSCSNGKCEEGLV